MEFVGHDNGWVVIFQYVISARSIRAVGGEYEFDSPSGPINVDVRTCMIATALRCTSPRDMVTFQIDPTKPDRLVFRVQNPENSKDSCFNIVLPMPTSDPIEPEDILSYQWHGCVTMPSNLFHDMIRDLSSADESIVMMECDGETFSLAANGLMCQVTFKVSSNVALPALEDVKKEEEEEEETSRHHHSKKKKKKTAANKPKGDEEESEEDADDEEEEEEEVAVVAPCRKQSICIEKKGLEWPARGTYPISFMQRVAKAKNVCSKISVHVRNNYPIKFVYDTQIGTLTYIIALRVEEDVVDTLPPAPKRPPAELVMTAAKRRRQGMPAEKKKPPPKPQKMAKAAGDTSSSSSESSSEEEQEKSEPE